MVDPDDKDATDDKTVKEMIDAATRAELERWFGLPSFQEVAERPEPVAEDPEVVAVRERRAKAIAAVEPWMLEAHRRRTDPPEDLIQFKATLEVRIDPDVTLFDQGMLERQSTIADPREVEIPEQLVDDLKECTPQAILRDLHRPEMYFDKTFEIVDPAAEQRLDAVSLVDELMSTRFAIKPDWTSPFHEGREILRELRADRLRSWADALPHFPNRRVTE
jgi:hypothetical protein